MTEIALNQWDRKQFYRDNKGQKLSAEDFDYVDTKHLQINSLFSLMDSLGYDWWHDNTFHRRDLEGWKGCEVLSLNTAVKLHNLPWVNTYKKGYLAPIFSKVYKMGGSYFETAFLTDAYTYNQAKASKLTYQVFLNGGKDGIVCYKNAVALVDKNYEEIFLRPLVEKDSL